MTIRTPSTSRVYMAAADDASTLGGLGSQGFDSALAAFQTELDAETGAQQPRQENRKSSPEPESGGQEDDETDSEDSDVDEPDNDPDEDDPDSDDESGEADDDVDAEDDDEGDDSETSTFTVRVNGKDQELTLDELKKGYSRQADYTRGKQELSEQNRKMREQADQLTQAQQEYSQYLEKLKAFMTVDDPGQQYWDNLYQQDPDRYAREVRDFQQRQNNLQLADKELERVRKEQERTQQERDQETIRQQREYLDTLIPDWADETTRTQDIQRISRYGESRGFTADELSSIRDARSLAVLNDAAKWQALQEKRKQKGKQGTEPDESSAPRKQSKGKRTMRAGRPQNQRQNTSKASKSAARQKKSGNMADTAAFFRDSGLAD